MTRPGWRAVWAMAVGVPVALACGLVAPRLWVAGPAWVVLVLLLMGADALLALRSRMFHLVPEVPSAIETVRVGVARFGLEGPAPLGLEAVLEATELLDVRAVGPLAFSLTPRRRGTARLLRLHVRWRGPLGLISRQLVVPLDRDVAIIPAVSLVQEEAARLFSRERATGTALQRERAESMEFHALREYQRGDDPRGINWRQSARHGKTLVRETRAERNRTVMLAVDTGRLMSEPLAGGVPRLDHAINAALVMAYAGLKLGDRMGLFAFDARPVLAGATVLGTGAFGALQRMAAGLEYSAEETNFTLGLTELGACLGGRSLVILMTEFADTTGAELMLENVGRLLAQHVVLFVTFEDDELSTLADAEPRTPDDVSRAVVAGSLLAERDLVLARLRRMGAEVLSAPVRQLGPALIRRYVDLKRRDGL